MCAKETCVAETMAQCMRENRSKLCHTRLGRFLWPTQTEPEMETAPNTESVPSVKESQWSIILSHGRVETFAPLKVETLSKEEERPQLVIRPYFGSFAGHKVTFDLKRTNLIRVKVEGYAQRLTLYHRNDSKLLEVHDRCLRFAHDVSSHQLIHCRNSTSLASSRPTLRRKPLSLSFMCEQTILLNLHKLPIGKLPAEYRNFLTSSSYQDVTINVWPRSACPTPTLLMRVKNKLSTSELEWMICHRLSIPDPSLLKLYHKDFLSSLDSDSTISVSHLECILEPSFPKLKELHATQPVLVSVIGLGIKEFLLEEDCSYREFEQIVRDAFHLQQDSFLYIPQIMRSQKDCPVFKPIDQNHVERSFSTSYTRGIDSHLFKETLKDLDVFSINLLVVFEVTGPSIPVYLKTFVCMSNGLSHDDNFAQVVIRPYAVHVSPHWSTDIFLKYIECISGFPCKELSYNKKKVTDNMSKLAGRKWIKRQQGLFVLKSDIPLIKYM